MLINYASKYETYNHLLNLIVIKENIRNSIKDENQNIKILIEGKLLLKLYFIFLENKEIPSRNEKISKQEEIANDFYRSEETLENRLKEVKNKAVNVDPFSNQNNNNVYNNDSIDSVNKKKKKFVYTKIITYSSSLNNSNSSNKKYNNENYINMNDNRNIYLESHKDTVENLNNESHSSNMKFIYEKIDTADKIDIEEIKSNEYILLDLTKFSINLLEKLTNGKKDFYRNLSQDYLKEKFSKIVDLVKYTRNSFNNRHMTSSSRNNSCCNDSNNSLTIHVDGEPTKNYNNFNNHNFKKIKFSNRIINDFSNKKNINYSHSSKENFDNNNVNNLNLGIDENFLLDLIIKDLVLITGIKYEKIERVINLLIKINFVNKNIKLREYFIFKEYPQNKKFLLDKILYIEKRIEAKYEKIKTINFYIKRSESKLAEINKNFNTKKNELDENKNYLKNFEAEINSMKENEISLKSQIEKFTKEKELVEADYREKISDIEKENKRLQEKIAKTNKKLFDLNQQKKLNNFKSTPKNIENMKNSSTQCDDINFSNTFKNSNFIRFQRNTGYNIDDIINEETDFNHSRNSNYRKSDFKNFDNKDNSSSSSINKYKRNRTSNLSNGNNIQNSFKRDSIYNSPQTNYHNSQRGLDEREILRENSHEESSYQNNSQVDEYKDKNPYNDIYSDRGKSSKFQRQDEIDHDIENRINLKEYKNSKNSHSRNSKSKSKSSERKNKTEFKVNNNIYSKYEYPNENRIKKKRDVSFDSYSIGNNYNRGIKNYYLFKNRNDSKKENSSKSSKKINKDLIHNYNSRSDNNINANINRYDNVKNEKKKIRNKSKLQT